MDLWRYLLAVPLNPVFGVGFESFWLGDRLPALAGTHSGGIQLQAHNGYLETYLNLGLLGLIMFFALIASTFRKYAGTFCRNSSGVASFGSFCRRLVSQLDRGIL